MSSRNRSRRFQKQAAPRNPLPEAEPPVPEGAIVVGRIIRSHGFDGTLRVQSYSDNPARFEVGNSLIVAGTPRAIAEFRMLPGGHTLLRLDGLESSNAVQALAGQWLLAPEEPVPDLPPGEYYHYQIVGLAVLTDTGEHIGAVEDVLVTGSNDVYVVKSKTGEEILIPAVSHVVKDIDLTAGRMLVHLIDGLR